MIPAVHFLVVLAAAVAIVWFFKSNPGAVERMKLYLIHCWSWYLEPTDKTDKTDKSDIVDSFQSSDHQGECTANSSIQSRTPKKSAVATKLPAPLSQPKHRHSPTTKQTSKKAINSSKVVSTQPSAAEETEANSDGKCDSPLSDSKDEVISNDIERIPHETATRHPTKDHSTKPHLVENLEAKDSSAFSSEKTNAVPEANTVDLAEAEDDFITAEKRKRRRTRGGAKAQRQKLAQLEHVSSSPDNVPSKKVMKKGTDEPHHSVLPKLAAREGNDKPVHHRHTHHSVANQATEPTRLVSKYSPKQKSVSMEDVRQDDIHITPKSSPRISSANATYANVAANTSSSSPAVEESTSPTVTFSPQQPVSPSPSHSSVQSGNDKRQSWYSPFSSGLELDIVPRPQSSLSSESVLFKHRPSSMAFDASSGNYQHPDVLNALFRGREDVCTGNGNALGLAPKLDNNENLPIIPELQSPTPYNRWDLFGSSKAPIAPPSATTGRPLSMAGLMAIKPEWDHTLISREMDAQNPRHSWGVIGNNETEGWSAQPEPYHAERKKSNGGFSFFDRRLSSFSPRR